IFQGNAFNWDERHHVSRAKPRVRAGVLCKINDLGSLADATNGRFHDRLALADQRNDAAIVVGIHLAVEQVDAINLHRLNERNNFGLVAAFRKIRNTFDQWHAMRKSKHARIDDTSMLALISSKSFRRFEPRQAKNKLNGVDTGIGHAESRI